MSELKPCDMCGAAADVPCESWCSEMAADAAAGIAECIPFVEESQRALMASMYRLPFVQIAGSPPDYRGRDLDMWLAELAAWAHDYLAVADAQIEDLQEQSRQRIGLQIEKDIVTRYLRGAA